MKSERTNLSRRNILFPIAARKQSTTGSCTSHKSPQKTETDITRRQFNTVVPLGATVLASNPGLVVDIAVNATPSIPVFKLPRMLYAIGEAMLTSELETRTILTNVPDRIRHHWDPSLIAASHVLERKFQQNSIVFSSAMEREKAKINDEVARNGTSWRCFNLGLQNSKQRNEPGYVDMKIRQYFDMQFQITLDKVLNDMFNDALNEAAEVFRVLTSVPQSVFKTVSRYPKPMETASQVKEYLLMQKKHLSKSKEKLWIK